MESSAKNIMAFRKASGLSVAAAKKFIEDQPDELCQKIIESKQKVSHHYDPIEDDPKFKDIIIAVKEEARQIIDDILKKGKGELVEGENENLLFATKRGTSHRIWHQTKKILKDRHNIDWYSPVEMNPGITFD